MAVVQAMQAKDGAVVPGTGSSVEGAVERDRLRMMMLIRRFEERTYQEYTKPGQKIGGFCHLYSGQEAIAVGVAAVFDKSRDALINGYRCHGHSLALGMEPRVAMAELFGKRTGCAKGKGGSMHFFDAAAGNHGGHGIVGGQLPLGLGLAFAQWYKRTGGVTFCLFGDGAVNQGTHNETLNLASLYKVPCIFIIENNLIAMGTQVERHSAVTDLSQRALGYNIPSKNVDGMDIEAVIAELQPAVERARAGGGPSYFCMNAYRYRGHSMSDPLKYRTKEEAEKWKARDPIVIYERRLRERNLVDDAWIENTTEEIAAIVNEAVAKADADPHPDLEERFEDVLSEQYPFYGRP
ncbi:MAG: pyruvate dehydrogenase (acetyl-transferring) E1 component subunit alpha [Phycisphaerae bacterium]|nr:pyruvate dehydrogenase (acetyl-transferring) E1 component subunit alpha [Phycisphaerae bacterium]MDW8261226.1 pyruvate dehydrogenase (acetyl-transferring) E1 component subunit alpha [Phycisphaerales bacterium]